MRLIAILGFMAYVWIVGFHDGHNPKPHIVYCPNGRPALVDWHGLVCEEEDDERQSKPVPAAPKAVQQQWRDA